MATNTVNQSPDELGALLKLMAKNIKALASVGGGELPKGESGSNRGVSVYFDSIQYIATQIPMIADEMLKLTIAPRPHADRPSREIVEAAANDAAVQALIKRASKKTPIRGK